MFILLWIVTIVVGLIVGAVTLAKAHDAIESRKTFALPRKTVAELSDPAKEILKKLKEVPADHRPDYDMVTILKALDKKHGGIEKVTRHFQDHDRYREEPPKFTWNCEWNRYSGRSNDKCSLYKDYYGIYSGLDEILQALARQEYALEMHALSGSLEDAKALTERLRDEQKLINQVTQELTQ